MYSEGIQQAWPYKAKPHLPLSECILGKDSPFDVASRCWRDGTARTSRWHSHDVASSSFISWRNRMAVFSHNICGTSMIYVGVCRTFKMNCSCVAGPHGSASLYWMEYIKLVWPLFSGSEQLHVFFFSLYPLGVLRQTEGWKKWWMVICCRFF